MSQRRDPKIAARKILSTLNVTDLSGLLLKDIVQHFGPYVKEDPMQGAQGRILFIGSLALITINSNIRSIQQARFVLAHEFGHAELHANLKPLFNCDEDSFKQWLKKGEHEQEANEFAAELLMPSKPFKLACISQDFSLDLISYLANRFQTSLMATAIRLVEQGSFSVAVIYSENNIIKWHTEHSSFPLKYVVIGGQTPPNSAARRWFDSGSEKPKVIQSDAWYFRDNRAYQYSNQRLRELLLPIPYYNGVLSFLAFE